MTGAGQDDERPASGRIRRSHPARFAADAAEAGPTRASGMQANSDCAVRAMWIAAFLDDELPALERVQYEVHLRRCRTCTAALAEQRTARTAVRLLAATLHAPPSLASRLAARLDHARPDRRATRHAAWQTAVRLGGLAAALLVLVLVGAWYAAHPVATATDLDRLVGAHRQVTLGPNPVALASSDPDVITAWTRRQTGHDIQ